MTSSCLINDDLYCLQIEYSSEPEKERETLLFSAPWFPHFLTLLRRSVFISPTHFYVLTCRSREYITSNPHLSVWSPISSGREEGSLPSPQDWNRIRTRRRHFYMYISAALMCCRDQRVTWPLTVNSEGSSVCVQECKEEEEEDVSQAVSLTVD